MNLGEATTYVLDRLQIPSSDTAKITQAQSLINLETARTNEEYNLTVTSAAATVAANTGILTLPADFQKLVYLLQTSVTVDLIDEVNFAARTAEIAAGTASSVSNPPTVAVYRPSGTGGVLYTLPIPTSSVAATLIYVQRPATMSSNATAIPLPVEYHDLICELVVRRMALTEGESAIAQIALDLANELRQRVNGLRTQQPGQSSWAIPLKGY